MNLDMRTKFYGQFLHVLSHEGEVFSHDLQVEDERGGNQLVAFTPDFGTVQ